MQLSRQFYVEKIDGTCIRLEPVGGLTNLGGAGAGTGLAAVIVETSEATPASAFWLSAASCGRFEVIIRRHG